MTNLNHDYWEQRWKQGETGWHQPDGSPTLKKHWSALALKGNETVLVPFCGKTPDMLWLASLGHRVIGVEISRFAIDSFFSDNQLTSHVSERKEGAWFSASYQQTKIEIIQSDVLNLSDDTLQQIGAIYDRGALVAQTTEQRQAYYASLYARLPQPCKGLLLTVDYPQTQKAGPPFAVSQREVEQNLSPHWQIQLLEQQDMQPNNLGFQQAEVDYANSLVMTLNKTY